MNYIKEKCPKYNHIAGKHYCELDNSGSQYNLVECYIEEFYQESEDEFRRLQHIYNLVKESNKKYLKIKITNTKYSSTMWYANLIGKIYEIETLNYNQSIEPMVYNGNMYKLKDEKLFVYIDDCKILKDTFNKSLNELL